MQRNERILIVDDTPANIDILGEILKDNYEINVAVNGETALEIAASENKPDLILLDIMMPHMDGYEVLKKLKQNKETETIPVIFVTAKIEDHDEAVGFSLGAVDYIRKPFSSDVTKARIKSQLELKTYRDKLENLVEEKQTQVDESIEDLKEKEKEKHTLQKELETQEESAHKNHVYFRELFTNSPFGIILVGKNKKIIRVNKSFCKITGFCEEEIINNGSPGFIGSEEVKDHFKNLLNKAFSMETISIESKCKHKKGFEIPVSALAYPVKINGSVEGVFVMFEDIYHRKVYEDKLKYHAFHDSLTGVPNRALFKKSLNHAIEMSKNLPDFRFAVMLIDLDRFKSINDSLGHQTGDKLLVSVTSRIKSCLRSNDIIARLGGDEFALLLYDIKNDEQVTAVAKRINDAAEDAFLIDGNEIHISASTGIVIDTKKYSSAEDLIRDADLAMYHAKEKGKACYKIYNNQMHKKALKKLTIEKDLRKTLSGEQLSLYFQPISEINTKRLKGFEALLRWIHPEYGIVSPVDFIPVAEETDLIIPMGEWVLEKGISQLSEWKKDFEGTEELSININISVKQFMQKNFTPLLIELSEKYDVSPEFIKIEITESLLMAHTEYSVKKLNKLKNHGFKIVIDDFGTGYSSLAYLHKFPVSDIKIDRTFTSGLDNSGETTEIIKSILTLSKNLGINVVAEGVENQHQLEILKELHCENIQGYYIARPLPENDAEKYIKSNFKKETLAIN